MPLRLVTLLCLSLLLGACASLRNAEPPEVTLSNVELLGITMLEQEWALTLRARNPNDFPLTLRSLDYQVFLEGQPFGRGLTNAEVTVPAMGDALVQTRVVTGLFETLRQLQQLDYKSGEPLQYRIEGSARVGGSPLPLKFDHEGEIGLPAP